MTRAVLPVLFALLGACAILPGGSKQVTRGSVYLIEAQLAPIGNRDANGCHIVVVQPPENAPGQIGSQMIYQRHPHQIERFAFSRWAATPAAMIEPLLLDALRTDSRYSAVIATPAAVRSDFRVENNDLWLIQKFDGGQSHVELQMNSRVYVPESRQLLGTRSFSYSEPSGEGTPEAGVVATGRVVRRLLEDFRTFVGEVADQLGNRCEQVN